MQPFDYTVIAPLYRNGSCLQELVQRLLRLPGARVLLVEDGSGEALTLQLLPTLAGPRVGALILKRNAGQHRAIFAGLEAVGEGTVVVMDGDLQDSPESIPLLLEALERAPIAFAQRTEEGGTWIQRATSLAFKFLLRLLSRFRLPARAGTFVALKPEVVKRLLIAPGSKPYLLGLLSRTGFAMTSVPIARPPRSDGGSSYNLKGRLRLAWRALRSWGSYAAMEPVVVEKRFGWVALI